MKWSYLSFSLLLGACGWFGSEEKDDEKPSETAPRLVGRVNSVPARGGFVLIESYQKWNVPEGGLLQSMGGDRRATLKASGEKLGQFVAADIRAGSVEPGDLVYHRPLSTPAPDSTPAEEGAENSPENQKTPPEKSLNP